MRTPSPKKKPNEFVATLISRGRKLLGLALAALELVLVEVILHVLEISLRSVTGKPAAPWVISTLRFFIDALIVIFATSAFIIDASETMKHTYDKVRDHWTKPKHGK